MEGLIARQLRISSLPPSRVKLELRMAIPDLLRIDEMEELGDRPWIVTVYDNDTNTFEEVIAILMIATHCSQEEAEIETWEINYLGKSVVHVSEREECESVRDVIAQIGIRVEVSQES